MSLLKKIFSNNSEGTTVSVDSTINWINLESVDQIEVLKKQSELKTCVVFKHSTRCGTSRMALKAFEKKWADTEDISFYFLDLLRHRDISNAIANDFEVFHQSPQLIVLEKGKVRAHASHYDILNIAI